MLMPAFFISASALAARSLAAALARSKKLMGDLPDVDLNPALNTRTAARFAHSVGVIRARGRDTTAKGGNADDDSRVLVPGVQGEGEPGPFALQNKKLLRIDMRYGEVWARTGSMVAYQGDVRFVNKGSGGSARCSRPRDGRGREDDAVLGQR